MGRFEVRLAAVIYEDAVDEGLYPTKAVMEEMELPRSAAGRLVRRARDLGFLEEVEERTQARRNPRAVRVAEALGVPYEDLVNAILTHADGDLRVTKKEH